MRIPVDIVCLDPENTVVSLRANVQPWRIVFGGRATKSILEAPAGFVRRQELFVGVTIEYEDLV